MSGKDGDARSDARSDISAILALVGEFGDKIEVLDDLRGDPSFRADGSIAKDFIRRLRDEFGFGVLSFLTAVDNYLDEPRFEVSYRLRSMEQNLDLRINVPAGGEDPAVDSVTDLFHAANWLEREVWDMFGVRFRDHPNLERILMWEGFEGHPLRKDYPLLGNTPGTPGHAGKGAKA